MELTLPPPSPGPLSVARLLLLASVWIASVFFLIPLELYYPQRVLWGESTNVLIFFALLGLVSAVIAGIPLTFLCQSYPKQAQQLALSLFLIGIFVLFADLFAPLQSTPLNGWAPVSSEPLRYTATEGAIAFILIFFWWRFGTERFAHYGIVFAYFTWLLAICYFVIVLVSPKQLVEQTEGSVPLRPELRNIYHIVLDELQSDAALVALEDNHWLEQLTGFTIFPYNRSNYLYTKASFPSYMTGTIYNGEGEFEDWLNIFHERGIIKALFARGYQITMFAPWRIWKTRYAHQYSTLSEERSKSLALPLAELGDFFPIWLARCLPNVLSNEAFQTGSLIERRLRTLVAGVTPFPHTINEGRDPFDSVVTFRNVIAEERNRSPFGRYLYLHNILPHGPYVVDQHCEYTRLLPPDRVLSYYHQTICSLRLVIEFINELKRLGRYDQSIIIVHADTGHGHRGFISSRGKRIISSDTKGKSVGHMADGHDLSNWTRNQVLARTLAFLMIKPADSAAKRNLSLKASQLIDLFPTLMSLIGETTPETLTEGRRLFETGGDLKERDYLFYRYDYSQKRPTLLPDTWPYDQLLERIPRNPETPSER